MPVYDIGSQTAAGGAGTTVVVTILTQAASYIGGALSLPAIGDLLIVKAGIASTQTIVSCTDSKGQTYTPGPANVAGAAQRAQIFTLVNAQNLTAADTVTVTYGSATGGKAVIMKGATGVASATVGNTNNGNATSAAPSSGATGALTLPRLVLGIIYSANAAGALTGVSFGAAGLSSVQPGGGALLTSLYDLAPPAGGEAASGTLAVSSGWAAVIGTVPLGVLLPRQLARRTSTPRAGGAAESRPAIYGR